MATKRVDWMDFAHLLHKERVTIAEKLPRGLDISLHCDAYDHGTGAQFSVTLTHRESGVYGYGRGPTPAKALEDSHENLRKNIEKAKQKPRLVEATPKALES